MQVHTVENANIYQKPERRRDIDHAQVTIGDLHANAMKFLYFLIGEGIFDISDEDYLTLAAIYRKDIDSVSDALLKADIRTFNEIVDNRLRLNQLKLVRLVGDEVGDRGQNDYFILKILQKLHNDKVPVEIMMSNHGVELAHAIEKYDERGGFERTVLHNHLALSLDNLEKLRKRSIVSEEDILGMVEQAYKPCLKALSYSLNGTQNEITLFSHAAIDVQVIQYMAKELKLNYADATARELAQTIDNINASIQAHIQQGTLHTLYSQAELEKGYRGEMELTPDNPLEFTMWNRNYENAVKKDIHRVAQYNGYRINYVHGHDSSDPLIDQDHICNLDGMLGKDLYIYFQGQYKILASNDVTFNCANEVSKQFNQIPDIATGKSNDSNDGKEVDGGLDLPSMFIIGGFVAAVGIAAVTIAISVLSMGTVPAIAAGTVCSSIALVTALTTYGFFNQPISSPPSQIELKDEVVNYI